MIPEAVYLDFAAPARPRAPLAMKRTSERQFEATFVSVIEPFEFRARGGDAVTDWVRVDLVEQPTVAELKLIVTPPSYAGDKRRRPAGWPRALLRAERQPFVAGGQGEQAAGPGGRS